MDYLNRDSFFTGVSEGVIGYDRIIKMLAVHEGELAVEAKGTYSVENFIISRRLMYWQVYLHKTVIGAEEMLIKTMERAREMVNTPEFEASPILTKFLSREIGQADFEQEPQLLEDFAQLDDSDIFSSLKAWTKHPDKVLSYLSTSLLNRRLYKVHLQNEAFSEDVIKEKRAAAINSFNCSEEEAMYLVFSGSTTNSAYAPEGGHINILFKDGSVMDIAEASDQLNISVLKEPVVKHYLCYPKELDT
jgi:HD superfamily phosphohydrolase